ncbi:MAG: amidohydrolase family protein [Clostridia bacterium]
MNGYRIIDCHCHIGDYFNFHIPANNAEGMIKTMDTSGIDIACIAAHMALVSDPNKGNDIVYDAVERFPDRFRGYITVNPHFPEDTRRDMEKAFHRKGIIGIKIHTVTHRTGILHPGYTEAYEAVNGAGKLILIHTDTMETLKAVEVLSERYPRAAFLLGHFGGTVDLMKVAMEITRNRDNVYGDTATSLVREANVRWFHGSTREGRLLYGSDMPFFDPRPTLGRILYEDIPDEAKADILGNNMESLIRGF